MVLPQNCSSTAEFRRCVGFAGRSRQSGAGKARGCLIDRRGEEQLHAVASIHFHGFVQVAPLVFCRLWRMDANPAQAPAAADNRQQSVALLICSSEHPQARALSAGAGFGQALGQGEHEDFGRERILFGVGLARHLQDRADFSQQLVDAR